MRLILAAVAALLVIDGSDGLTAHAQQKGQACAPRDKLLPQITGKYGEARRAMGTVDPNGTQLLEVWASPKGSWTLTLMGTNGILCVMATGQGYHDAPMKDDET